MRAPHGGEVNKCFRRAAARDHALVWAKSQWDCVPVLATDPLYILYTSGTTGIPKGVVRDNGGHMVALKWSMKNLYGVEPGETTYLVAYMNTAKIPTTQLNGPKSVTVSVPFTSPRLEEVVLTVKTLARSDLFWSTADGVA